MPRPKPKAKPTPEPEIDDGPTVGQILGLPNPSSLDPDPYLPGFAVMADDPSDLVDPYEAPSGALRSARAQASGSDQAPTPRPGDVEPPPGQRPPEPEPQPEEDDPEEDDPEPEEEDEPDPRQPAEVPDRDLPPVDQAQDDLAELNAQRRRVYDAQRQRHGIPPAVSTPWPDPSDSNALTPSDADFAPSGEISHLRYVSRVEIIDAFRYPGNLTHAPAWIDRNWIGYGDYDPVRGIDAGPCLRVPSSADPNEMVLCRIGDYVCRQSVLLKAGRSPVIRTEVWTAAQFDRLFIPVERPQIIGRALKDQPETPDMVSASPDAKAAVAAGREPVKKLPKAAAKPVPKASVPKVRSRKAA